MSEEKDRLKGLIKHWARAAKDRSLNIQVGEACSSPLLAISSLTTVNETAYVMASKHVRRLPVAENGDLVGIITARDLVAAYAR